MTTTRQTPCALVTGAGQGIGRGIALCLAEAGYDIIANDIFADPSNLEKGVYEVKRRVEELGRRCLPVQGDVSKAEDHQRLVEAAARELAGLPLAVLRNRRELGQRADAAVRTALRPFPVQVSPVQLRLLPRVYHTRGYLSFQVGRHRLPHARSIT